MTVDRDSIAKRMAEYQALQPKEWHAQQAISNLESTFRLDATTARIAQTYLEGDSFPGVLQGRLLHAKRTLVVATYFLNKGPSADFEVEKGIPRVAKRVNGITAKEMSKQMQADGTDYEKIRTVRTNLEYLDVHGLINPLDDGTLKMPVDTATKFPYIADLIPPLARLDLAELAVNSTAYFGEAIRYALHGRNEVSPETILGKMELSVCTPYQIAAIMIASNEAIMANDREMFMSVRGDMDLYYMVVADKLFP